MKKILWKFFRDRASFLWTYINEDGIICPAYNGQDKFFTVHSSPYLGGV